MPHKPVIRHCGPIRVMSYLYQIIDLCRAINVTPVVARSIVVLAPISTSSSIITVPICSTFWCPFAVVTTKPVGAEHDSRVNNTVFPHLTRS